jgi:hypothetical protein
MVRLCPDFHRFQLPHGRRSSKAATIQFCIRGLASEAAAVRYRRVGPLLGVMRSELTAAPVAPATKMQPPLVRGIRGASSHVLDGVRPPWFSALYPNER